MLWAHRGHCRHHGAAPGSFCPAENCFCPHCESAEHQSLCCCSHWAHEAHVSTRSPPAGARRAPPGATTSLASIILQYRFHHPHSETCLEHFLPLLKQGEVNTSGLQGQISAGTSSFGMSGVNAHAALCSAETGHSTGECTNLPWQRLRHWFAPAQHALLSACAKLGGTIAMVARLGSVSLAYLQDHQV